MHRSEHAEGKGEKKQLPQLPRLLTRELRAGHLPAAAWTESLVHSGACALILGDLFTLAIWGPPCDLHVSKILTLWSPLWSPDWVSYTNFGLLCCFSCVQLFATWWTIAHQSPLSMELSRQEYWSGLPCPPPGDLSNPGIAPALTSICTGRQVFTTNTTVVAQMVKSPPDPTEKEMAIHSSILAWEIPWTEEPGWATIHEVAESWTLSAIQQLDSSRAWPNGNSDSFISVSHTSGHKAAGAQLEWFTRPFFPLSCHS